VNAQQELLFQEEAVSDAQEAVNNANSEDENYQELLDALALAQSEKEQAEIQIPIKTSELDIAETELEIAKDAIPYVTLYPGCMRTPTACKAYGNMPNYGGFPFVPPNNPLERQVI
jgi:hypothetical protein